MNWDVYNLPFEDRYVRSLKSSALDTARRGAFFKGTFELSEVGDTFIDIINYKKGMVWVNGQNLGRFWEIGPQRRLFCPGPWLKKGKNEIIIFDLHQNEARDVKGEKTLE